LVASKTIEVVEVKKEQEIETLIPTFAIKLEQVEKDEVMHKKAKLNGIPKLMQGYTKQVFKLILLLLGSIIVTPKRLISS
jgi:hypothetical protein